MEEICENCSFYAAFEGVCCNGDSEWRGGNPPDPDKQGCDKFRPNPYL